MPDHDHLPMTPDEKHSRSRKRESVLRVVVCASVGDGKSTLLDGLDAGRGQADANDVAFRTFSTDTRKFIVADIPGHDPYTRHMVTGASTADAAVILIDARKGVLTQTRRHSYLASLLGIRKVALVVNKLDLVGYAQDVFDRIEAEYRAFARRIGLDDVACIPASALKGDNIAAPGANTPWYHGPTLMGCLESVPFDDRVQNGPFRMPVQSVDRVDADARGFSGRVVGGSIRPGDSLRVLPSGRTSTVARLIAKDGDVDAAAAGDSITVTLHDAIEIGRGDMLASADSPPGIADQFEAAIIWLSDDEMLPGRPYLMKIGATSVGGSMATPKYRVNVDTLEHVAARTLRANEIGVCNLHLEQPIAFDPYLENRDTGGFSVVDRRTGDTIGAGLLNFALRRSQNIHWQAIEVNKQAHAALNGHKPCVVWFTGLSGSGKSTIANIVEKKLHALGRHTYLLDGDNVRHGLNNDLGFTDADRVENIRRVAEVAKLMVDAGLIVLVSFISPFLAERRFARERVEAGEFCEVFVDTPLDVAEKRDTKGLYKKARSGNLKNFTGIDSPYEDPEHAEVRIDTVANGPEDAAEAIVAHLRRMRILD